MKCIIFVMTAIVASVISSEVLDLEDGGNLGIAIADIIKKTIEGKIANMSDTYTLEKKNYDFDNGLLNGKLEVKQLIVNGIKNVIVTSITLDETSKNMNLGIKISKLSFNVNYKADLAVGDVVPIYGEGYNNLVLEDLVIDLSATIVISENLTLDNTQFSFTMGMATFNVNGLINNPSFSALMSMALNDNLVPFINNNKQFLAMLLSPLIEIIINTVLQDVHL